MSDSVQRIELMVLKQHQIQRAMAKLLLAVTEQERAKARQELAQVLEENR